MNLKSYPVCGPNLYSPDPHCPLNYVLLTAFLGHLHDVTIPTLCSILGRDLELGSWALSVSNWDDSEAVGALGGGTFGAGPLHPSLHPRLHQYGNPHPLSVSRCHLEQRLFPMNPKMWPAIPKGCIHPHPLPASFLAQMELTRLSCAQGPGMGTFLKSRLVWRGHLRGTMLWSPLSRSALGIPGPTDVPNPESFRVCLGD